MKTHTAKPTAFTLRPALESDVTDLFAMIRELAEFEKLENELQVTASGLREALFGTCPVAFAIIAITTDCAVGYAIYYRTFSSFVGRPGIFLEDLYVRPAIRKQGIGRALLDHVADIAAESHCGRMEWNALRWNENALRFYRGVGALELNEWVLLRMDAKSLNNLAAGKEISNS
jgi:GNAT superfamily N-acetyltransferase